MKPVKGTVIDDKHIKLEKSITLPAGTPVQVEIRQSRRYPDYFRTASAKALEDEKNFSAHLVSDRLHMNQEDPWW
jgi:hypothetical protein